jgi:hypothetical protein
VLDLSDDQAAAAMRGNKIRMPGRDLQIGL